MDLRIPCNPFAGNPKTSIGSTSRSSYHWAIRSLGPAQDQRVDPAPVSSPTSPVHLVTVHDRQQGIVHQFRVPEVWWFLLLHLIRLASVMIRTLLANCRISTFCTLRRRGIFLFHSLAVTDAAPAAPFV